MAHYLVTGGAGFIGSNIVEELLRRKQKVRILDNFSTGKRETVEFLINKASKLKNSNGKKNNGNSNLEVFEGDLRSYHIVREAVEGVDYILHQGALPSVPRSVRDPITSNEVNVVGTLNILNAAKETKVRRIVYASSSSCYGDLAQLPKTEDMLPNPFLRMLFLNWRLRNIVRYSTNYITWKPFRSGILMCLDRVRIQLLNTRL